MSDNSQELNNSPELDTIMAANGEPFKTEKSAKAEMTKRSLSNTDYKVTPYGPGFAIMKTDDQDPAQPAQSGATPVPKAVTPAVTPVPKEQYFRVVFQDKTSPNDTTDVILSVNNESLVIQRNKEVVVPARYLECSDHATYPQYRQEPNQPRKIVGHIKVYPYQVKGPATEAEFYAMRKSGTLKNMRDARMQQNDAA